jgi:sporulation protein YabP
VLFNRSKLNVSGVSDVVGFDNETVVVDTNLGRLTVKGQDLKVMGFTVETGDLKIEGTIAAIAFTESSKKSMFSRLFG